MAVTGSKPPPDSLGQRLGLVLEPGQLPGDGGQLALGRAEGHLLLPDPVLRRLDLGGARRLRVALEPHSRRGGRRAEHDQETAAEDRSHAAASSCAPAPPLAPARLAAAAPRRRACPAGLCLAVSAQAGPDLTGDFLRYAADSLRDPQSPRTPVWPAAPGRPVRPLDPDPLRSRASPTTKSSYSNP